MFLGHYQLGSLLPVRVWCRTSAGVPTEPDAAPLVQIHDDDGDLVYAASLPIVDRGRVTGYFFDTLNLDQRFEAGRYSVLVTYALSSTRRGELSTFEILPGGDPAGAGISMCYVRQDAADYVLLQNDAGTLAKLKNPEVRNR